MNNNLGLNNNCQKLTSMGLVSDTNQCSANNGDQETKLLMDNQVKCKTRNCQLNHKFSKSWIWWPLFRLGWEFVFGIKLWSWWTIKISVKILCYLFKAYVYPDVPNNKVHFHTHTDKEKDDVSLYGTPKEEVGTVNTSRWCLMHLHYVIQENVIQFEEFIIPSQWIKYDKS